MIRRTIPFLSFSRSSRASRRAVRASASSERLTQLRALAGYIDRPHIPDPPSLDTERTRTAELIGAWRAGLVEISALSAAAARLLAFGVESPSIVGVAALYSDENPWRVERLVMELERDVGSPGSDEPAARLLIALRWLCGSYLGGAVTAGELSAWAQSIFEHAPPEVARPLAELGYELEAMEWSNEQLDASEPESRVRAYLAATATLVDGEALG